MFLKTILCFVCIANVSSRDSDGQQERILGCNGFVKSDLHIDFSKIEVKLISKEGNLKYKIECAPNNGYFFLPIYDKGSYTLQVSSAYKWVFEPNELRINFNGVDDPCSKSQDMIFTFKGFRVFGKVDAVGDQKGPKGITITLVIDLPTEQKEIQSVITGEGGNFDISPILPGTYILKASHSKWRISKSLVTFNIVDKNFEVPTKSLLFVGYDVSGSVVSNGEPIPGVHFVLFSLSDTPIEASWISGCSSTSLESFDVTDLKLTNAKRLCHVTSNDQGSFAFASVPSGSYAIVPFYRGTNSLKFDVHPRVARFSISQDSYTFSKPFMVSGFNVIGRVLSQPTNGKPLLKVKVILNKEKTVETNSEGLFLFESVKSGSHHINVKGDGYQFSDIDVKIAPNTAVLENIYPSSYEICGKVQTLQHFSVSITFVEATKAHKKIIVEKDGTYCSFLPQGNYTVNVSPTDLEQNKVMWFFPINYQLEVTDRPLKNIDFRQETAQLTGKIDCVDGDECDEVNVFLKGFGQLEEEYKVTQGGKYKFIDLYPGHYEIGLSNNENWCWEFTSKKIFVSQVRNEGPTFTRTGVSFTVSSSHDTPVKYRKLLNKNVLKEGVLDIKQGSNLYCLPGDAVYELEPVGCHRYAESVISREVGQDSLALNALTHEITVKILSSIPIEDLKIVIYKEDETVHARLSQFYATIEQSQEYKYVYRFQFQVAPHERMIIEPNSSSVLFTPNNLTVHGKNDCMELEEYMVAKRGIRLEGSIQPPLIDVKISILNEMDEVVVSMLSDADGKYKFAPLHSDHNYRIVGEKEGYVLSGPFENGTFRVHKLAEIQVSSVDNDGKTLQGVLLSLSGGENYRRTSQSNADGKISFLSLRPGEYYLRPVLKEYKFLPQSKVVYIKEGETVSVIFKGQRVLYSIFGSVLSLNRIPEKDVVVEAIGKVAGDCVAHQEEGTTDENGRFRIRGMQPGCEYDIRIKNTISGPNKISHKSLSPNIGLKMSNKDVDKVDLIAIPEVTVCDVSVFLELNSVERFRTLQLKLMDENGVVLHTLKLSDWKISKYPLKSVLLPLSTLPLNNKNYLVQLESSLPKSIYSYNSQVVYFSPNTTFQLIRMSFSPELKLPDSDVKHSYSSAVLIAFLSLLYWRKDLVLGALSNLQNNTGIPLPDFLNRYLQSSKGRDNERTFIEFEPGLTVVKRKLKPRKM